MEEKTCSICGETNREYFHTLDCNHSFHYNCLLLSFKNMGNNHCPYCRTEVEYLPIINGLKKVIIGVHTNKSSDLILLNELTYLFNYYVQN